MISGEDVSSKDKSNLELKWVCRLIIISFIIMCENEVYVNILSVNVWIILFDSVIV